jgi:ketosteroid isomerase-like protein
MSQENVEIVRILYEAVNRGDWSSASHLVHPDFEWTTSDRVPNAGTYRGLEEVRRFFEDQRRPFEEVVSEPERFVECDDRIVALALLRSKPRGSDAIIESRIGHLWTMRDGKAVSCKAFAKRDEALEAVGLSEEDAHADS